MFTDFSKNSGTRQGLRETTGEGPRTTHFQREGQCESVEYVEVYKAKVSTYGNDVL